MHSTDDPSRFTAHSHPSTPRDQPSTPPHFLLSRATGSVRAYGTRRTFSDPWDAVAFLHDNPTAVIVGALPFQREAPSALTVPHSVVHESGPLELPAYYRIRRTAAQCSASIERCDPSPEEHKSRVAAAIDTIKNTALEKVVLARAVDIAFESPIDPLVIVARLLDASAQRDGFIADLTPAGSRYTGVMFVGASPEVLIRTKGRTVTAYPMAGSAARLPHRDLDQAAGTALLSSGKDNAEHRFVVEHLERILRPLCTTLTIPQHPELTKTTEMWHLATPIHGTLKNEHTTALELALAVHPTPAICGTPTDAAEAVITSVETQREFYAGTVGWSDAQGNGEYMVAIRCAQISADRRHARTWAGGGIVAESNPEDELRETTAKLQTFLKAVGLGVHL